MPQASLRPAPLACTHKRRCAGWPSLHVGTACTGQRAREVGHVGRPLGAQPAPLHKVGREAQLLQHRQHARAQPRDVGLQRLARDGHQVLRSVSALPIFALRGALVRS